MNTIPRFTKGSLLVTARIRRVVLAVAILTLAADRAYALTVTFDKSSYASGDAVKATITAAGSVGIENDITQSSSSIAVAGSKTVDLGVIPGVGFYRIAFNAGLEHKEVSLLVIDGANAPPPVAATIDSSALGSLEKFYSGWTKQRFTTAWNQWNGKQFLAQNAVPLATGVSFGIVCAHGVVPACAVAFDSMKDVSLSFAAELFIQVAKVEAADGHLTAAQYTKVETAIRTGKVLLGLVGTSGLDTIISGVEGTASAIFDATVEDNNTQVGVSVFRDQAKKTYLIYKKLK